MSFTNDLFIVAYNDQTLDNFYDDYRKNNWFSKEENGEFTKISIPSNISKDEFVTWWTLSREGKDLSIYKFNDESSFTVIMYDSLDIDSILCKEIILKQYSYIYNRNIEDWKKDGMIVYDVVTKQTDYPTYEGHNIFYPENLDNSNVDEIFICGYSNISTTLLEKFLNFNESVYLFENNPYKINCLKNILKNHSNSIFRGTRSTSKTYQAFSWLRDPIKNIKPSDNKAFKAIDDYSKLICLNFSTLDEWRNIEKIKKNFESKMLDSSYRKSFVDALFGISNELDIDSLYEDIESTFFSNIANKNGLNWSNDVIAINTLEMPSVSDVEQYVSINQKYSMILTFYKGNNDFWTVRAYRTPRPITSISYNDALDNTIYYLENGSTIKRISSYNDDGKLESVEWFYILSNKMSNAKVFVEDSDGEYVLKNNSKYEKFINNISYSENEYVFSNGLVKRFNLNNSNFTKLYPDLKNINFNAKSLSNVIGSKYLCKGNAYVVEMSMTDKQFYSMLNAKSLC